MLKFDSINILVVLLVYADELPKIASIVLAFLAGLSLKTGSELWRRTFTARKFFIRLLMVFGLAVAGMFYWQQYKPSFDIIWYILFITVFAELIVHLFIKYGEIFLRKYFKRYGDE